MTGPNPGGDPDGPAFAAALCRLPGMGPATLASLLGQQAPRAVWEDVVAGRVVRPAVGRRASGPVRTVTTRETQLDLDAADDQGGIDPEEPARPAGQTGRGARSDASGRAWSDMASQVDPVAWWAPHVAAGVGVTWMGAPDYPRALADDPAPPGVLFWIGDLAWLQARRVALVGTRRASPDGRRVAYELGRDLAAAGVCVISGLALGIDGAAHAGAVAAVKDDPDAVAPVAVVASGVDQPYPPQHRRLWDEVGRFGAIVSETLPGRRAEAWRFPVRNRIIAGLSQMVVIVESHAAGGSLITAEAALARGIEVRAVPGSIHNPASAGSNQLLYDGPGPVRSAQDVLDGLGVFLPARPTVRPAGRSPRPGSARTNAKAGSARPGESGRDVDDRPTSQPGRAGPHRRPASGPTQPIGQPTDAGLRAGPIEGGQDGSAAAGWSDDPTIRQVLEAIDWQPTSLGQIADRCPLAVPRVMAALDRLERLGWAARERQWWVRTVTSP